MLYKSLRNSHMVLSSVMCKCRYFLLKLQSIRVHCLQPTPAAVSECLLQVDSITFWHSKWLREPCTQIYTRPETKVFRPKWSKRNFSHRYFLVIENWNDVQINNCILIKIAIKGKVFRGQEPDSGEYTTTECGVNYQLLAVIYWSSPMGNS